MSLAQEEHYGFDQGSDIEIPVIQICEGWSVDELQSLDDCDDAHAYLTGAICAIEDKIDTAVEEMTDNGKPFRRLKRALRWKKAALQVVQLKRGKISRAERKLEFERRDRSMLEYIRKNFPKEFAAALGEVTGLAAA